jgi:hypothetical protein
LTILAETFMFKRRIQDSTSGPTTYIAPDEIVRRSPDKGLRVLRNDQGDCDIDGQ